MKKVIDCAKWFEKCKVNDVIAFNEVCKKTNGLGLKTMFGTVQKKCLQYVIVKTFDNDERLIFGFRAAKIVGKDM